MAQYGQPMDRGYPPQQGAKRDAVFANIFGGNRSQPVSSYVQPQQQQQSPQPPQQPQIPQPPQLRSASTSSHTSPSHMSEQDVRNPSNRPVPAVYDYSSQRTNTMDSSRGYPMHLRQPPPLRNYGDQRNPNYYGPESQRAAPYQMSNGAMRGQQNPTGQPINVVQRSMQGGQNVSPYSGNPRSDPRYPQPNSFTRGMPPRGATSIGSGMGVPAIYQDPSRAQSMASIQRPVFQAYNPQASRQPNYANNLARTTPQGRVVPDRTSDERTMSMSSYTWDRDFGFRKTSAPSTYDTNGMGRDASIDEITPAMDAWKGRVHSQGDTSNMGQTRSMSMASTLASSPQLTQEEATSPRPSMSMTSSTVRSNSQMTGSTMVAQKRTPLVYGALLSKVAQAFRERIGTGEKEKDGLVYKNAFTGHEAVELIAYIIRTSDRNLALLLGRSLDAQKLFHEVSYAHRLRDSPHELYQFKEALVDEPPDVNGVFTLLTECYSPTCTRDHLCYSIACPRRLEQQSRLNLKLQPGLKRQGSQASLHEEERGDDQRLWINTVSSEVADSVGDGERRRQEVLAEIMYTERDFVKDLEYLRDFWIKPLRNPAISPIPEHRREKFIRTVFSNCQEVHAVNVRLASALTRRQQQSPVVRNIGDIFLEYVPQFSPFIKYGANQLFGKFEFEKEKLANPQFARFVEETERLKESRKLELNGYLTKPTTRLARYPLLLQAAAKSTAADNADIQDLPKAVDMVKEFLTKVNEESGKAENIHQLAQLNQSLNWGPLPPVDLKLTDESRQIVFKSAMKKTPTAEVADIQAYLFDHAVLLVRQKVINKREEQKVYRKPIPLELLVVAQVEEMTKGGKRPSAGMIAGARAIATTPKDQGYPITFRRLGKGGYELTLYCTALIQRDKWLENVEFQQRKLRERSNVFTKTNISEHFFSPAMRVNCCVPIDGARKLLLGTDFGIYSLDRKPRENTAPRKLLDCKMVTQIDVLEQHRILLVLSDKVMYTFLLDAIYSDDSQAMQSKRGRKICHGHYFNAGVCNGKLVVCCVKSSSSSTVRVYEPMESVTKNKKKTGFSWMLAGGQDVLRLYKVIYLILFISLHTNTFCRSCTYQWKSAMSITFEQRYALVERKGLKLSF